jgi:hypothetical protein
VILRLCLEIPRARESGILPYAVRLQTSIRAGESPEALRMQVAKIQMALGGVVNDAICREAVKRASKLVAINSN